MASLDRANVERRAARRWVAPVVSVGLHAAVLFALLSSPETVPVAPQPEVITVSLVRETAPAEAPAKAAAQASAASAAPAKTAPPQPTHAPSEQAEPTHVQPTHAQTKPAHAASTSATTSKRDGSGVGDSDVLTGAGLGSAIGADGLPGGSCNMARRLQAALRRDTLVRAAVVARGLNGGTSALLVWNGGWVASPGEDGRGLAAVREAIVWEVAFAPAACREEHVHGPVLFTLSDATGLARIAVGAGDWRWRDLVSSR